MKQIHFEWDDKKEQENIRKHSISFEVAQYAFLDPNRVIAEDSEHSNDEDRYFCIGYAGDGIVTVRFTYRGNVIRIFGAGYWRKGKRLYETQNKIHGRTYGNA